MFVTDGPAQPSVTLVFFLTGTKWWVVCAEDGPAELLVALVFQDVVTSTMWCGCAAHSCAVTS